MTCSSSDIGSWEHLQEHCNNLFLVSQGWPDIMDGSTIGKDDRMLFLVFPDILSNIAVPALTPNNSAISACVRTPFCSNASWSSRATLNLLISFVRVPIQSHIPIFFVSQREDDRGDFHLRQSLCRTRFFILIDSEPQCLANLEGPGILGILPEQRTMSWANISGSSHRR